MTKILCIDDEPKNLKLMDAILTPAGYEILQAENGEKGLKTLQEQDLDLILLDIMMPGLSGYDVLKKIRADEKVRDIPVVMVTALTELEDRVKALDAGCDDFISKPFEKIELLARVKSLVRVSYFRRQLNEKEKFESVLNQMDEGLIVIDNNFKIVSYNKPASLFLGIEPDKIPDNLVEYLTAKYKVNYQGDLQKSLKSEGISFDVEREATEKFKELILDVKSSVIKRPEEEPANIVLTFRDVTNKRLQDRLEWTFFDTISHKFRSPLSGMLGQEAFLKDGAFGPLNAEQQKSINTVYEQSLKLSTLLDKILKFILLAGETMPLPKEDLKLKEILPEIGEASSKQNKGKKVDLKIDCEDILLRMNKKHLEMILNNLIENAIKFNDNDPVVINIAAKKTAQGITLSIADNGRGIPPEDQEKIFEGFYQVEKYLTGNVEGMGLGLSIVKSIVKDHGGKVSLKSTIGKGSEFIIELPSQ